MFWFHHAQVLAEDEPILAVLVVAEIDCGRPAPNVHGILDQRVPSRVAFDRKVQVFEGAHIDPHGVGAIIAPLGVASIKGGRLAQQQEATEFFPWVAKQNQGIRRTGGDAIVRELQVVQRGAGWPSFRIAIVRYAELQIMHRKRGLTVDDTQRARHISDRQRVHYPLWGQGIQDHIQLLVVGNREIDEAHEAERPRVLAANDAVENKVIGTTGEQSNL
jgi:hypothetical protein